MKVALVFAAALASIGNSVVAAEVPEGTVISKDNVDKIKDDTFMGHKIADLLTEPMLFEIRKFNRTYLLEKQPDPGIDKRFGEMTQKHASKVAFDSATREVTGYVAGVPFPAISASDPAAGDKVMWNFYYGAAYYPGDLTCPCDFPFYNAKTGFESSQKWTFVRARNRGRIGGASTTLDDKDWLSKTYFVATAPQDIKGTGTYTVRYDNNKLEDQFVYVKSARRTRRLTGNAWMDPAGPAFDYLNDDLYVYNSRPSRYVANKLIGKRWILASVNFQLKKDSSKTGTAEEFPQINHKEFPSWNPLWGFTPREVWVVEGTPPPEHPYSKKVVYVDTKLNIAFRGENYDKKGEFWRMDEFFVNPRMKGKTTGVEYVNTDAGGHVDFKTRRASWFFAPCTADTGWKSEQFSPDQLANYQ